MAATTKLNQQEPQQTSTSTESSQRFIKLPKVKSLSTFSASTIYRRVADGTFPPPVTLGPKSVAWLESEVLDWIEARIQESREEVI